MTKTVETKLEIKSWDENPYREFEDGRKFTRADVQLGSNDGIESATFEALMIYRSDGTSSYVSVMEVAATLDGHSGSFVLQGTGSYDGTTAVGEYRVVPGAGTAELAGLTGTLTSSSTHADYPNMPLTLSYSIE
jgi:hypothetical protein